VTVAAGENLPLSSAAALKTVVDDSFGGDTTVQAA
jgi:hypothetical protein